jgi:radical SAM protein (TIGR01212 family)
MKQWNGKRYYSLDTYLKETFHEKIYKLSLNAGMTCPNRDGTIGTGGCIFCSEGGSGDFAANAELTINEQIEIAKVLVQSKASSNHYIAYFQAYTNTYASYEYLEQIYLEAISHPDIVALSIATRPDCLPEKVVELLYRCNQIKPVFIELGLQTCHEETALLIHRGYPLSTFDQAVNQLSAKNLPVVVHIILGLPKETKQQMLETINYLNTKPIHGIKLQLLYVLKQTQLEKLYLSNPCEFHIMKLETYVDTVIECIQHLRPDIVIHRMTGDGPKNLLIAPSWSSNKRLVLNTINQQLAIRGTYQGSALVTKGEPPCKQKP